MSVDKLVDPPKDLEELEAGISEGALDGAAEESKVPDQFQGKSVEEMAEINLTAQQQISRQGNEIGELRKLTDQLLQNEVARTASANKEIEDDLDWEYDTEKSVKHVVDNRVNQLEEKIAGFEKQTQLEKFEGAHPDYKKHVNDARFVQWVQGSPYRSRMYEQANAYDYAAAADLFTEWEGIVKSSAPAQQAADDSVAIEKKAAVRQATLEKGGSSGSSKPTFTANQLIHMRIHNPEKYESMRDEITQAYIDGRVSRPRG